MMHASRVILDRGAATLDSGFVVLRGNAADRYPPVQTDTLLVSTAEKKKQHTRCFSS